MRDEKSTDVRHQSDLIRALISITLIRAEFEAQSEVRGCLRGVILIVAKDVNQLNCFILKLWGGETCYLRFWCLLWSGTKRFGCFGNILHVSAARGARASFLIRKHQGQRLRPNTTEACERCASQTSREMVMQITEILNFDHRSEVYKGARLKHSCRSRRHLGGSCACVRVHLCVQEWEGICHIICLIAFSSVWFGSIGVHRIIHFVCFFSFLRIHFSLNFFTLSSLIRSFCVNLVLKSAVWQIEIIDLTGKVFL